MAKISKIQTVNDCNDYDSPDLYDWVLSESDDEYLPKTLYSHKSKLIEEEDIPDYELDSYLGTCSESEFAFEENVEPENQIQIREKIEIAPEDEIKYINRPRPRGTKPIVSKYIFDHQYDADWSDEDDVVILAMRK